MLSISFKFRDDYTGDRWLYRHCLMESVEECIEIYGLTDPGVEYEILEVRKVDEKNAG